MNATNIEWTDRVWNPTVGCRRVSKGCENCYAETMAARVANAAQARLRSGGSLTDIQSAYRRVVRWERGGMDAADWHDKALSQWNGRVEVIKSRLFEPLTVSKPTRWFVDSMSDLFHGDVPEQFQIDVFGVMFLAHWHTFQVLTKLAERMAAFVGAGDHGIVHQHELLAANGGVSQPYVFAALDRKRRDRVRMTWPLPNVWLGFSAEDQERFDERWRHFAKLAAAGWTTFCSAEPLLGPIKFGVQPMHEFPANGGEQTPMANGEEYDDWKYWAARDRGLKWVIVGGESGSGARIFNPAWARSIVRQCQAAGVPAFVKQLGQNCQTRNDDDFTGCEDGINDEPCLSWPEHLETEDRIEHSPNDFREEYQGAPVRIRFRDRKGGDPSEWPAELRVRKFPEVR